MFVLEKFHEISWAGDSRAVGRADAVHHLHSITEDELWTVLEGHLHGVVEGAHLDTGLGNFRVEESDVLGLLFEPVADPMTENLSQGGFMNFRAANNIELSQNSRAHVEEMWSDSHISTKHHILTSHFSEVLTIVPTIVLQTHSHPFIHHLISVDAPWSHVHVVNADNHLTLLGNAHISGRSHVLGQHVLDTVDWS